MGNGISSQPAFRSLGAREGFLYTDNEKAQLFANGMAKIQNFLTSGSPGAQPRSVPELVRRIFDGNSHDPDIDTIRQAIRPTYNSGSHDISATGTKLLACLAIAQDSKCFDDHGNLRVAYTKSVICGWFSNGDTVSLDESALINIRKDSSQKDKDGNDRVILGKNRLANVRLYDAKKLEKQIESNRNAANLRPEKMQLDLSTRPIKTVTATFNEAALGDMHANSIMFLHQLVQLGLAEIPAGGENSWDQLVDRIKKNDVQGFRDLLPKALELKQPQKKLVLLGDLLSDRSFNDWFMLSIIDFLHEKNQVFDIIFSNHDAAFIEYYLFNKDKSSNEDYATKSTKTDGQNKILHATKPNSSLEALTKKLNDDQSLRQEFLRMTANYVGHLSLVGCSEDQRSLYSHGIVNEAMMSDMLGIAGKTEDEIKNMGLQEKTRVINSHFHSHALGNLNGFQQLFHLSDASAKTEPNPFYLSIWNTGPFHDNNHINKEMGQKYLNADVPVGAVQVVHGHTKDMKAVYDETEALSRPFYELLKRRMTDPNPPSDLQNWISDCITLFISLASKFAANDRLGTMFTLFLDKARSLAASDPKSDLEEQIDSILEQYKDIPMHEVNWFNTYSSTEVNDPVMQEKRRQNPMDPAKATFGNMSKDPTVQDEIKHTFKKAQNDALAALKKPTQDLFDALHTAAGLSIQRLPEKTLENFSFAVASMQLKALDDLKKIATASNGTPGDLHAQMIASVADQGLKAIKAASNSRPSEAVRAGMDDYFSLDDEFGKSPGDSIGSRSAFLA